MRPAHVLLVALTTVVAREGISAAMAAVTAAPKVADATTAVAVALALVKARVARARGKAHAAKAARASSAVAVPVAKARRARRAPKADQASLKACANASAGSIEPVSRSRVCHAKASSSTCGVWPPRRLASRT